jgi:LysM repeat protein
MRPKQWTARYGLLVGVAGGALLLAACGGGDGTATGESAATTVPASASPARTVTRVATAVATTGAPSSAPVPTVAPTPPASVATATAPPASNQQRYVVQSGDTLSGIAAQYGVPIQRIIDANSLQNPDLLLPGQELIIPAP